jgi:hypothetical protein
MALLIADLTGLYAASKALFGKKANLEYGKLNSYIKNSIGVEEWDYALGFTLIDFKNDKQKRFVSFLEEGLGWNINCLNVLELLPGEDGARYRFDANIAFTLGKLAPEHNNIVIITDSYALAEPLLDLASRGKTVSVAFFNTNMDPRWFRRLFYDEKVGFIDLHEMDGSEYNPELPFKGLLP